MSHLRLSSLLARRLSSIVHIDNPTMSKELMHELDLKMQQMKEYAQITRGYHNENFQYPIHVRRSHDGEKFPRTFPSTFSRQSRSQRLTRTPILASSSHENQTSASKAKPCAQRFQTPDEVQPRTFIVPPNKTVNDIDPSLHRDQSYTTGPAFTRLCNHRKSSSSSLSSSPVLCSLRPHSIACLSTTETITTESTEESSSTTTTTTDNQPMNSLSNSSQSLINQSTSRTPIRTMTQKFFSKLFHNPPKS